MVTACALAACKGIEGPSTISCTKVNLGFFIKKGKKSISF
jgi:hypothetical protein